MLRWSAESWVCDRCGAKITPTPRKHSTTLVAAALGAAFVAVIVVALAIKTRLDRSGGRSREDMVDRAVTAVATGNVDDLVDLAGYDALRGKLFDCDGDTDDETARIRRRFERAAVKHADLDVSVVDVEVRDSKRLREGTRADSGCRYKADATSFELRATVKVGKNGRTPRERKVKLEAIRFGGGWYLTRPPDLGGGMDDAPEKMREMSDRMCACRDKACADRVQDEFTKWGTEMARNAEVDVGAQNDEDTKQIAEAMKSYNDCMTKAMQMQ
jgi:hypothetical protein